MDSYSNIEYTIVKIKSSPIKTQVMSSKYTDYFQSYGPHNMITQSNHSIRKLRYLKYLRNISVVQ